MSDKIVIVGPRPNNAHTGVAVGFSSLIQALEERQLRFVVVNLVLGGTPDRPGAASFSRILTSCVIVLDGWIKIVGARYLYMTLSTSSGGFLRGAALILWASLFRCRIVVHLKGGGFREFYDSQSPKFQKFIRYVMQKPARIIALGHLLVEQFSVVPGYEKRVVVIPNGFPGNMVLPESRIRTLTDVLIRILYLSNIIPSKGIIYLIEAVELLIVRGYHVQLEIAGTEKDVSEDKNTEFEKFVASFHAGVNRLGKNCRYHGAVFGKEKKSLLEQSDVFCLPTFYPWEGQPISIIEALAYGLPVISTPHKGIPEEVIDGVNGFLVEPRSVESIVTAIKAFCDSPQLYQSFSEAARKHFEENFTCGVHQKRLVNCILGIDE